MHPDTLPLTAHDPVTDEVRQFLETVVHWPVDRWHAVIATSRRIASDPQRATAAALRDAILTSEGLTLAAWFTGDAARTAAELLPAALSPRDHDAARALLTEAALALLARPSLPTLDLALLLAPFLPLHLPTPE